MSEKSDRFEERLAGERADDARDTTRERIDHLEALLRAGDAALEAAGVANDGSAIATRIGVLGNRGAVADRDGVRLAANLAEVKERGDRLERQRDKALSNVIKAENEVEGHRQDRANVEARLTEAGIAVDGRGLESQVIRLIIARNLAAAENERLGRENATQALLLTRASDDKRDLKTRLGALLGPVDVEAKRAEMAAVAIEAVHASGAVSLTSERVEKAMRPFAEREAMLAREVARLTAEVDELRAHKTRQAAKISATVMELERVEDALKAANVEIAQAREQFGVPRPVLTEEQAREMAGNLLGALPIACRCVKPATCLRLIQEAMMRVSRGDFGAGQQPEAPDPKDDLAGELADPAAVLLACASAAVDSGELSEPGPLRRAVEMVAGTAKQGSYQEGFEAGLLARNEAAQMAIDALKETHRRGVDALERRIEVARTACAILSGYLATRTIEDMAPISDRLADIERALGQP